MSRKRHADITLAELEALAERMEKAARVMREALSVVAPQVAIRAAAAPADVGPVLTYPAWAPPPGDAQQPTPAQLQKAARLAQHRAALSPAERAEKLAQFRHDAPEEEEAADA